MNWTTLQPFKTANGLSGYHGGKGPTLVLLHGVGLKAEFWAKLIKYLIDDFSIYAIDLPGHGASQSLKANLHGLADYSDVVAAYLKTFQHPVYLVGHSMGAMIALDIATKYPAIINTVAALNGVFRRSDMALKAVQKRAAQISGIAQGELKTEATLTRWFGPDPSGDDLESLESCTAWLHATPITDYMQAYYVFAHHDGPTEEELSQLKMPALFVTGSKEPNSTPDMSRQMAKISPIGKVKIIKDAAHMMPMTHAKNVALTLKYHFSQQLF